MEWAASDTRVIKSNFSLRSPVISSELKKEESCIDIWHVMYVRGKADKTNCYKYLSAILQYRRYQQQQGWCGR